MPMWEWQEVQEVLRFQGRGQCDCLRGYGTQDCRGCKECSFRGHKLSQQEQYEQQVIESKIEYDPSLQAFSVSYPFSEDPSILRDNIGQVIKIGEKEEDKLEKEGLLDAFNNEFDKIRRHGAMVELSQAEIKRWGGPVHYVSLQHVIGKLLLPRQPRHKSCFLTSSALMATRCTRRRTRRQAHGEPRGE